MSNYETLDSGKRQEYASGAKRDTSEGKPRYDLLPVVVLTRWAELMTRGAAKYGDHNWKKGIPTERFYESAFRHLMQYASGDTTEDHLAAVLFNVGGIIYNQEHPELFEDETDKSLNLCHCEECTPDEDCQHCEHCGGYLRAECLEDDYPDLYGVYCDCEKYQEIEGVCVKCGRTIRPEVIELRYQEPDFKAMGEALKSITPPIAASFAWPTIAAQEAVMSDAARTMNEEIRKLNDRIRNVFPPWSFNGTLKRTDDPHVMEYEFSVPTQRCTCDEADYMFNEAIDAWVCEKCHRLWNDDPR